ncbi:MAG: type II secretion system F family protein [Panacagrimonas sp.]
MQAREASRLQKRMNPGGIETNEFTGARGGELLQTIATRGKKLEALVDTNKESARLLLQAGWRTPQQRATYYVSQALVPLALLGLVGMFAVSGPAKLTQPILLIAFGLAAVMLGLLLPRMVLRSIAAGRVRRIKSEVPLFIHLLVLLFEAGLSTRQAFASLVRDGGGVLPELGREFDLMLRQMEAGGETGELLDNLARAIALEDLGSVLALLRQVDRYGGEVREPLLEALKVLEERRSMDVREMVNLMSGRMNVVMVAFFFPALLIFVAGPAFLSIITALSNINK